MTLKWKATHGIFLVSSNQRTLHPRYMLQRKQLQLYRNTHNLLQYHKHTHPSRMRNNTVLGQPSQEKDIQLTLILLPENEILSE